MNVSTPKWPDQPATLTVNLPDQAATERFAAALAPLIKAGMVIHLSGDLGAGKTTFCRAFIRSLGYNGRVKSPTFTLVEPYNLSSYPLYHFDFYRFSSENELRDAGFEEQLDSDAVALVEWPERAGAGLPAPDLLLRLDLAASDDTVLDGTAGTSDLAKDQPPTADQPRQLTIRVFTERASQCLNALIAAGFCAPV